jgi:hypothetical protein
MRRLGLAIAMLVALSACAKKRGTAPLDYVDDMKPGIVFLKNVNRRLGGGRSLWPAGRLEGIEVEAVAVAELRAGEWTGKSTDDTIIYHLMMYNVGRDDVFELLEKELGEPLGEGQLPLHPVRGVVGHFWQDVDGWWVCGKNAVGWYSNPVRIPGYLDFEERRDLYNRPAPRASKLWMKIGRLLVGLDTAPRT